MIIFNFIILRLNGNTGIAAYGIVAAISLVVVAIYTGVSQGIQPIISRNHGISNRYAVKVLLKYTFITTLFLSAVIYGIIFFFASPIALAFNGEHNNLLQNIAVSGLKIYFISCPFLGFNITLSTYFTATERSLPAHIISMLRGFFVIIPAALILSAIFEMAGIWCAFPVSEIFVSAVGVILLRNRHNGL